MRVLFLCHLLDEISLGGVAEFVSLLPAALKKINVEVVLYNQAKEKEKYQLSNPTLLPNGVPHYSGPFLRPRFFLSKSEMMPLIDICQREKIDLIHAQSTYRAGFMAMHIKKRTGIPYIVTSHGEISESNSKRLRKRTVKNRCKQVLQHADYVTHVSAFMADCSHRIFNTENKSAVIHNGIDVNNWQPQSTKSEYPYLLAIGRLEPEKGFLLLLDVLADLKARGIPESMIVAGSGSIENELQMKAQQLGLNIINDTASNVITRFANHSIPPNSVIFTGYVRAEQKKLLFAHANIILFATQPVGIEEAFGLVQLEAMAAAKAFIASDISATRYLQQLGAQSVLVEGNNVSAWTSAITSLLAQDQLRKKMEQQNLIAVNQFNWDTIAIEYANLYAQVIKHAHDAQ